MITNQEIFDRVADHLIKQGKPARDRTGCRYRGPGGTQCALGCLIKDEFYSTELEGSTFACTRVQEAVFKSLGVGRERRSAQLLYDLQDLHDGAPTNFGNLITGFFQRCDQRVVWKSALRQLAKNYNLQVNF